MSQESKTTQESYNTSDLAGDLSKQFGFSKAQALRVVTATFALIGNAIARDAIVRIHQFGNYKRLETKERQGRNPKTGEPTTIDASARPHFVASTTLKQKVKSGEQESVSAIVASSAEESSSIPSAKKPSTQKAQQPKPSAGRKIPRKPTPAPQVVEEEPIQASSEIDEL